MRSTADKLIIAISCLSLPITFIIGQEACSVCRISNALIVAIVVSFLTINSVEVRERAYRVFASIGIVVNLPIAISNSSLIFKCATDGGCTEKVVEAGNLLLTTQALASALFIIIFVASIFINKYRDCTVIAIRGASGSGKTTLSKELKKMWYREIGPSHTTRSPREGERSGEDYYFISDKEFSNMKFVEKAEYSGCKYGVSKKVFEEKVNKFKKLYMILDLNGIEQFKNILGRSMKVVQVHADLARLEERMRARGDSEETLTKRINNAIKNGELANCEYTDYSIYNNGRIEDSKEKIREIALMAESEKNGREKELSITALVIAVAVLFLTLVTGIPTEEPIKISEEQVVNREFQYVDSISDIDEDHYILLVTMKDCGACKEEKRIKNYFREEIDEKGMKSYTLLIDSGEKIAEAKKIGVESTPKVVEIKEGEVTERW